MNYSRRISCIFINAVIRDIAIREVMKLSQYEIKRMHDLAHAGFHSNFNVCDSQAKISKANISA